MPIIYLTSVKLTGREDGCRSAIYSHVVNELDGDYGNLTYYKTAKEAENKVRELMRIIPAMKMSPTHPAKILVYLGNHEAAWDLTLICSLRAPEFLSKELWNEFMTAMGNARVMMSQFVVKESVGLIGNLGKESAILAIKESPNNFTHRRDM